MDWRTTLFDKYLLKERETSSRFFKLKVGALNSFIFNLSLLSWVNWFNASNQFYFLLAFKIWQSLSYKTSDCRLARSNILAINISPSLLTVTPFSCTDNLVRVSACLSNTWYSTEYRSYVYSISLHTIDNSSILVSFIKNFRYCCEWVPKLSRSRRRLHIPSFTLLSIGNSNKYSMTSSNENIQFRKFISLTLSCTYSYNIFMHYLPIILLSFKLTTMDSTTPGRVRILWVNCWIVYD